MLRFFRAIRRSAIGEGRLPTYLLYAVGEILLVVVGILIALQVNNWNDERKMRGSEQVVLGSLLEEFESNRESLRTAVAQNQSNIASALEIGQYTGPDLPEIEEAELSALMVGAFKENPRYTPSLGGLYEVINSGKLSILSDPDLRTSLASFESELDLVRTQEEYVIQYQELAHRFFIEEGNFRRHLNVIDDRTSMPSGLSGWPPSRFPNNDFRFLENRGFESYLYLYIVAASNLDRTLYTPLGAKMDSITDLIHASMEN